MNIIADQYLYKLKELIPEGVNLTTFDPKDGFPGNAHYFDALLIRTVTKINADTLPIAGNLTFIGTATAGFDHMDRDHLKSLGITFGRAAGCNARAVAEYVITCLYRWADNREADLHQKKVGIVGCGHTGGAVMNLLEKLSISYLPYDPPKNEIEPTFQTARLDDLLQCDILTFHTPLTAKGTHPTFHMCDALWLNHKFDLIINTARGGVVQETDLLNLYHNDLVGDYILDVWETEPVFSNRVAENAFIATPHIAGYSREAKLRASQMVAEEMCRFFNLQPKSINATHTPPRNMLMKDEDLSFSDFMWNNNQIDLYDTETRKLIGMPDKLKGEGFATLRAETPTRFEYRTILKSLETDDPIPDEFKIFGE
jgi:erythronate-4-phosphate dehydrogenase